MQSILDRELHAYGLNILGACSFSGLIINFSCGMIPRYNSERLWIAVETLLYGLPIANHELAWVVSYSYGKIWTFHVVIISYHDLCLKSAALSDFGNEFKRVCSCSLKFPVSKLIRDAWQVTLTVLSSTREVRPIVPSPSTPRTMSNPWRETKGYSFHSICFHVKDISLSATFYEEVLGMSVVREANLGYVAFVSLTRPDIWVKSGSSSRRTSLVADLDLQALWLNLSKSSKFCIWGTRAKAESGTEWDDHFDVQANAGVGLPTN